MARDFSPLGFAPSALLQCVSSTRISRPTTTANYEDTSTSTGDPVPIVFGTVTIRRTKVLAYTPTTEVTRYQ